MSSDQKVRPLLTFGVITDVQYANCDDRPAIYDPSKIRFYRQSLDHVESAFVSWKNHHDPVRFALQLGDVIDGLNVQFQASYEAMEKTLKLFESHQSIPTFHTVGNHELYNFKRQELALYFSKSIEKMSIPPEIFIPEKIISEESPISSPVLYYKFCPHPSLKFISLDCFDISVLGHNEQHPAYKEAETILEQHHKHNNYDLWDSDGPLQGLNLRFQQMNGAIGKEQLLWLEQELIDSDRNGQKVIVFGHVSLFPQSTDYRCLLWNYEAVIDCFHRHHCVIAYLSGHSHASGYALDSHGIHYIVFAGIIETHPKDDAFATISVYSNKLEVHGYGREHSYNLPFLVQSPPLCNVTDWLESEATQIAPLSIKVEV